MCTSYKQFTAWLALLKIMQITQELIHITSTLEIIYKNAFNKITNLKHLSIMHVIYEAHTNMFQL